MKTGYFLLTAIIFLANTMAADAAGFRLVETDNAGQGVAHAKVASVTDASAVYYNPAAMTEIDKYAAKTGFQFVKPSLEYSGQGKTVNTANETFAIPHLYLVKNHEELGFYGGFGVFTNFGLATTWPMDGPFRYVATDTDLKTTTFNFSGAKKFGEMLSIGIGASYMKSQVRYDSMYPFAAFVPGSADGIMVVDGSGSGFGFNAAALIKPNDKMKIGITYRSEIKTTLSGDLQLENFPGGLLPVLMLNGVSGDDYKTAAEVDLNFPAIIVFAVSYQATKNFLIEIDIDHTKWSSYDTLNFKFKKPLTIPGSATIVPGTSEVKNNWKDVTAYRLGMTYESSYRMVYRFGYYFDPTPVPEETLSPRLPGADRSLLSFGVGYKATDNFSIDASLAYLWTGSNSVENTVGNNLGASVNGNYENNTTIFGLSVSYRP